MGGSVSEDQEDEMLKEIELLQRQLQMTMPGGIPYSPAPNLPPQVIQVAKEEKQEQDNNMLLLAAAGIGAILLLRGAI